MFITNIEKTKTISINLTLQEMYWLSRWIKHNIHGGAGAKLMIRTNGCDIADYYCCDIVFENFESKLKTFDFIKSLDQECNFGEIQDNQHWITASDILVCSCGACAVSEEWDTKNWKLSDEFELKHTCEANADVKWLRIED